MDPIVVALSTWLASSLFGGYVYEKARTLFSKDKFDLLTERSLENVLGKEDNRITWNEIQTIGNIRIKDLMHFDFDRIFDQFSEEYHEMLQSFIEELKCEYLRQLYLLGDKDPFMRFILDEIAKLEDHEARISNLESIFPQVTELLKTHVTERLEDAKRIIELKRVDIRDFVGRKSILNNFPEGDVFIEGKATYGKTYLMLRLSSLFNGYYIPLDTVREKDVFELLIREARSQNKRVLIDDFHRASQEIQEYVEAYVWDVVIASRGDIKTKRTFRRFRMTLFEREDIREYFSFYRIGIDDEVLDLLGDELSLPIKLRIFVNYVKTKGISHLNRSGLENLVGEVELRAELNDFYKKFVFHLFGEKHIQLCYILSLLRFPASVGRLSLISRMREGEVSKLLEEMEGVLECYGNEYTVFHDSFREFCLLDLGDAMDLHKKVAIYFEGLGVVGKVEGMYHYRMGGWKDGFRRVFDLGVVQRLIDGGLWMEAEEDLEVGVRVVEDAKMRADVMLVLGTVYYRKGDWGKASIAYGNCLKVYGGFGDVHGMAQTYNNLGSVYARKGEWDKAIEYYEKDLEIFEKLGDVHGMAQTYNNLGSVYARKGEWDKAIEYYEKSLEIFEKLGDVHGMALTKYGIAGILHIKRKFNEALAFYHESEEVLKRLGDPLNLMNVYYNLSLCYHDLKEEERAYEYYNKAEEIREQLGIQSP